LNQIDQWINEVSYGKTRFQGDVFGWYPVPKDLECSNPDRDYEREIIDAADPFIDFTAYQRLLILYPTPMLSISCTVTGYSTVGKVTRVTQDGRIRASISVLNAYALLLPDMALRGALHELGHGLGVLHANAWSCGTRSHPLNDLVDRDSSCKHIEYGNPFDIMGVSGGAFPPTRAMPHMNAYFKELLGWLEEADVVVAQDGEYTLAPIEIGDSDAADDTPVYPKALKIPRTLNPATGEPVTWYYVEYRQPIGEDKNLAGRPRIYNGVLIQWVYNGRMSRRLDARLLDATPETNTFRDAALAIGEEFFDSYAGITITPITGTDTSLTLIVSGVPTHDLESCCH